MSANHTDGKESTNPSSIPLNNQLSSHTVGRAICAYRSKYSIQQLGSCRDGGQPRLVPCSSDIVRRGLSPLPFVGTAALGARISIMHDCVHGDVVVWLKVGGAVHVMQVG